MNKKLSISLSLLFSLTATATASNINNSNIINGVEFKKENEKTYSRVISITEEQINLKAPTEYELISTEDLAKISPVFNNKYSYVGLSKNNSEILAKEKETNQWVNLDILNPIDLLVKHDGEIIILTNDGVVKLNENNVERKYFSNNFLLLLEDKDLDLIDSKLKIKTYSNNSVSFDFYNSNNVYNFYYIDSPFIFNNKIYSKEEIDENSNLHGFDRESYSCITGMSKEEIIELSNTIKVKNESSSVTDSLIWNIDKEIASNFTNDHQKIKSNIEYKLPLKSDSVCQRSGFTTKIVENDTMIGVIFVDYLGSPNARKLSYFAHFYDKTFSHRSFVKKENDIIDLKAIDNNKFLMKKTDGSESVFNIDDLFKI